uniref:Uncharacterized protein n=1 Tax=Sipha flava TaxID=143950 RepID=A0A2S2QUW5_9HEMI
MTCARTRCRGSHRRYGKRVRVMCDESGENGEKFEREESKKKKKIQIFAFRRIFTAADAVITVVRRARGEQIARSNRSTVHPRARSSSEEPPPRFVTDTMLTTKLYVKSETSPT